MTKFEEIDDGRQLLGDTPVVHAYLALGVSAATVLAGILSFILVQMRISPLANHSAVLAGSVAVAAAGAGAFMFLLNYFVNPVATKSRLLNVLNVYAMGMVLLVALVDAGAFHPRLAITFIIVLGLAGVVFALFHREN